MLGRWSSDSARDAPGADPDDEPSDRTVRRTIAGYLGAIAAATAFTTGVAVDLAPMVLGSVTVGAFAVGAVVSQRIPDLPVQLGRTRLRRIAPLLPTIAFVAVAVASVLEWIESAVAIAALSAAFATAVAGFLLSDVVQSRRIDAVIDDEPIATYRWQPPRSPVLAYVVLGSWLLLAGVDAYAGDWFRALVWAGLGLCWLVADLAEGRFRFGSPGAAPEIRIHEAGLVQQRPFTRSLVRWDEVDHVRLREDELVLDRGFADVRFDRGELEGITLEEVLVTIKKRLAPDGRVP